MNNILNLLNKSKTPYHLTSEVKAILNQNGFIELKGNILKKYVDGFLTICKMNDDRLDVYKKINKKVIKVKFRFSVKLLRFWYLYTYFIFICTCYYIK